MLVGRHRGRERGEDWRFALLGLTFVGIGCLAWGLILFGGVHASAIIHQGTMAIPLLAICACVAGLRATYPRLALGVVLANVVAVLVLYTPSLEPLEGTVYSDVAALLAAASLAGFAAVALAGAVRRSTRDI
jgi:hypothetical protein